MSVEGNLMALDHSFTHSLDSDLFIHSSTYLYNPSMALPPDCKPANFFTNSLSACTFKFIACKLHNSLFVSSQKENCVNATKLPFNTVQNFVCCLAIYRLCSRIFFRWTKLQRKIALCWSELSLNTPWNFKRTFEQTFVEKSQEQRMKFAHFTSITFAQYCRTNSVI